MKNIFELTAEFNRDIIGIKEPQVPTMLPQKRVEAFDEHICEELQELEKASTLADQIDAIEDIIFLAAGRLYEMGVDGYEHFLEVAYANQSRVRGNNPSKRPNAIGYDAIKPDGWVGPDHDAILAGLAASRRLPKRNPKILVLGHARHGKDTVAEMLRDIYGLNFSSSSMFCAEHVMLPYFEAHGVPYSSAEECYADRGQHRATWYNKIQDYNSADPQRLAREMLEAGNDMYVGMRSAMEYQGAKTLFDHIVWVDAGGRMPLEPSSSMTISFDPNMLFIRNDGTLDDLKASVIRLANRIGLDPLEAE